MPATATKNKSRKPASLEFARICARLTELEIEVGPKAEASVSLNGQRRAGRVTASLYPKGICGNLTIYSPFDKSLTPDEAIDHLREKWLAQAADHRANRLREMAIGIITLTHRLGECTDAALRGEGFDQIEIIDLGEEATTLATEMGDRGPFTIVRIGGRNEEAA